MSAEAIERPPVVRVADIFAGERTDREEIWIARYNFLKSRGYLLRPRYRPDWKAPWDPDIIDLVHEESITLNVR